MVAPLAGAWIEISHLPYPPCFFIVAPLAGAWIEIMSALARVLKPESLPLRERGLKFFSVPLINPQVRSLPLRERGLKFMPSTIADEPDGRRSPCGSVD